MKRYKTGCRDKKYGNFVIIADEAKNKKEFIEMLRGNGYSVNYYHVKEEYVYDWLIKNTNLEKYDWRAINTIEDTQNYEAAINKYLGLNI